MKCYKCGSFLYENDYCAECGADVSTYKHIVKKSNELYNRGLKLARDRNLSGAIEALRVSLKMYKANINARNLLGLIYIEIGEYAMGLAQWVISKSLQSENNMADHFLNELQNSRQDLNMMNVTIRKYNKAIGYVEQGNYDLAEIQLKKLLNDNPNMVKGHQLLALLFIRKKRYADARNALKKARKIDQGDPVTISYTALVENEIREEEQDLSPTELRNKRIAEKAESTDHAPLSGDDVIIPKSSYREYNPATMTIIQIIIGALIGAAIIFFVVMPAKTKSLRNEYTSQIADLNARIEQYQNAASGEKETTPQGQDDPSQQGQAAPSQSEAEESLSKLVSAQIAVNWNNYEEAKELLDGVDPSEFDASQKDYYESLKNNVNQTINDNLVSEGLYFYNSENYQQCIEKLLEAYKNGYKTGDVLYYLGRAYDYESDMDNTLRYLREYLSEYPDTEDAEIANQIINGYMN